MERDRRKGRDGRKKKRMERANRVSVFNRKGEGDFVWITHKEREEMVGLVSFWCIFWCKVPFRPFESLRG